MNDLPQVSQRKCFTHVCVFFHVPSPPEETNVLPHMSQVKYLINTCMYYFMHQERTGMCERFSTGITSVMFNMGVSSFAHMYHKRNVSHMYALFYAVRVHLDKCMSCTSIRSEMFLAQVCYFMCPRVHMNL